MSALSVREAYRLWAPTYELNNALGQLEDELIGELGPTPAGRRLLDAGCGTGWRLRQTGAARAVGLDLSPDMLEQGRSDPDLQGVELVKGDLRALPFCGASFDLVWCRLAIGYLPDPSQCFGELARVCQVGGSLVVTEFHPEAAAAGLRRTFRHEHIEYELPTFAHSAEHLIATARRAGLRLSDRAQALVGPSIRRFYQAGGRGAAYEDQRGQPMVLGLHFIRDG